jgi:hypothetical protein
MNEKICKFSDWQLISYVPKGKKKEVSKYFLFCKHANVKCGGAMEDMSKCPLWANAIQPKVS